jgi:type VI protein secretion system component VasF
MTPLELCEPLLQYMCRLNRSARKGGNPEASRVRSEIDALFDQMRSKASADATLAVHYELIELPLLFFVDFMVKESELSFAGEWHELAYDRDELAGDEKFFDLLEETLADQSSAATERLAVFYVCMGLGFSGWYAGQPEYVRNKMLECSARMRKMIDADESSLVCPEAYEHPNTSDLVEPAGTKLMGLGIAFVGLALVVIIANVFLFKWTSDELTDSLAAVGARQSAFAGAVSTERPAEEP